MMDAIDVMGFAGAFTVGTVQAGFRLVGKRELQGGFGAPSCEINRHLLGDDWHTQIGDDTAWETKPAELVFGNPPCSGFSPQTRTESRGIDAKINACMWSFSNYAARVAPQIVIMESVRSAHSLGNTMMKALRDNLEQRSGHQYDLYHVYQDALALGGAARRPRYFWVASRVPFGVEFETTVRRPVLMDVIGDLTDMPTSWRPQHYRQLPTWWSEHLRSADWSTDAHEGCPPNVYTERCLELMHAAGWAQGETLAEVTKRYYAEHGTLTPRWAPFLDRLVQREFRFGFRTNYMFRWYADRPAFVLNGESMHQVLHPTLPRTITHREALRIMGFPDAWRVEPIRNQVMLHRYWGKGVTVQCGKWIAGWARNAINGQPGTFRGELVGEREWHVVPPKITWIDEPAAQEEDAVQLAG